MEKFCYFVHCKQGGYLIGYLWIHDFSCLSACLQLRHEEINIGLTLSGMLNRWSVSYIRSNETICQVILELGKCATTATSAVTGIAIGNLNYPVMRASLFFLCTHLCIYLLNY
jgi:hypothetical protein